MNKIDQLIEEKMQAFHQKFTYTEHGQWYQEDILEYDEDDNLISDSRSGYAVPDVFKAFFSHSLHDIAQASREEIRRETIKEAENTAIVALDECYQEWDVKRKTSIPTFKKAATRIEEALDKLKGTDKEIAPHTAMYQNQECEYKCEVCKDCFPCRHCEIEEKKNV